MPYREGVGRHHEETKAHTKHPRVTAGVAHDIPFVFRMGHDIRMRKGNSMYNGKLLFQTIVLVVLMILWLPISVILDVSKHYK